ncbi:MAG: hypothetical protein ABI689_04835 [Thermoanaerobaculia bacterium]
MRFLSIAVLLLLAAGCDHETSGTPAAEPPRVATLSGAVQPAAEPAAPPKPPSQPAAVPLPRATTPAMPVPPATETPPTEAQSPPSPPVAEPAAPATPRLQPVTAPAAEPVAVALPQPGTAAPAAARAETPAPAAAIPPAPLAPSLPSVPVTTAEPPAVVPEMDLKALEDQLRQTKAIGFMTKITLKGQVNDLLDRFREYYQGKAKMTMKDLRRSYDLLMMKVLSLLQDEDQRLASAIVASREAIWGLLADPVKFETLQG